MAAKACTIVHLEVALNVVVPPSLSNPIWVLRISTSPLGRPGLQLSLSRIVLWQLGAGVFLSL